MLDKIEVALLIVGFTFVLIGVIHGLFGNMAASTVFTCAAALSFIGLTALMLLEEASHKQGFYLGLIGGMVVLPLGCGMLALTPYTYPALVVMSGGILFHVGAYLCIKPSVKEEAEKETMETIGKATPRKKEEPSLMSLADLKDEAVRKEAELYMLKMRIKNIEAQRDKYRVMSLEDMMVKCLEDGEDAEV